VSTLPLPEEDGTASDAQQNHFSRALSNLRRYLTQINNDQDNQLVSRGYTLSRLQIIEKMF
jgi:hypothetical protein